MTYEWLKRAHTPTQLPHRTVNSHVRTRRPQALISTCRDADYEARHHVDPTCQFNGRQPRAHVRMCRALLLVPVSELVLSEQPGEPPTNLLARGRSICLNTKRKSWEGRRITNCDSCVVVYSQDPLFCWRFVLISTDLPSALCSSSVTLIQQDKFVAAQQMSFSHFH